MRGLMPGLTTRTITFVLLLLALNPIFPLTVAADAVASRTLYGSVLPDQRDAVIAETAGKLSTYDISTEITLPEGDQPSRLTGKVQLHYRNDGPVSRDELYLRLYANDARYAEGDMALENVRAGGEPVEPEMSVAGTVARLPLSKTLAVGESTDVAYDFVTQAPTSPRQSYGIFSYQPDGGTLVLAHWFPMLAGVDPDGDWNVEPPSVLGDVIFSNTALFDVEVTAPEDLVLVTTGTRVARTVSGDKATAHFVSGPVRDFTMVLDDDYESSSVEVDGTTVTSWYNPEHAGGGEAVLRFGSQALALYNELFGPYPYEEVDLVDLTVRNGAAGVEFPQLMFIGGDYYDDFDPGSDGRPSFLETIVAHEVGHQWWYALVGNDQYQHAFIDEGLTSYVTTDVYFERVYDETVAHREVAIQLETPYVRRLINGGDDIADQPTDAFLSDSAYGTIIYDKAALGFGAIRDEIGDRAFFAALRAYAAANRFTVATPDDLLTAFETASNEQLDDLWHHWFEAAEGDQDYEKAARRTRGPDDSPCHRRTARLVGKPVPEMPRSRPVGKLLPTRPVKPRSPGGGGMSWRRGARQGEAPPRARRTDAVNGRGGRLETRHGTPCPYAPDCRRPGYR